MCKTTIKAISIQVAWLSKFHSQLGLVNRYAMSLEREAKSDFRTFPYLSVPISTYPDQNAHTWNILFILRTHFKDTDKTGMLPTAAVRWEKLWHEKWWEELQMLR